MVTAMKYSVTDSVSFAYPVICPVEYGESAGSYQNSFQVTGLFDGYVQSYISHKRKPYPDIFMQALEEVRTSRVPTGEALRYDMKPNIFYFDDVEALCEVARELPGNPFTDVLLIEDGALRRVQGHCACFEDGRGERPFRCSGHRGPQTAGPPRG
uniref:Uncharacterized protein n=1 Tax=Leishmania donovani TaxID=5661 RepID=Q962N8_LEIDO|nr:unknown [Leishmania donovani]